MLRELTMKLSCCIIMLSLFLYVVPVIADLVGSDAAVSEQNSYTFPQNPLIVANRIASFAWMQAGFVLQNSSTSCTFDSVFPVSGTVQLNGGTLTLNRDLIFNNLATLQGLGVIVGGDHTFQLCSGISSLPSNTSKFQDTTLIMNGPLTLNSAITFQGDCQIVGNGSILNLGNSGSIIVGNNASLTLKNLIIQNIAGTNIQCTDDTGDIFLDTVIWDQSASSTFALGSLQFDNNVTFVGTNTFYYTSSQTSTIASASTWQIAQNLTLSIGAKSSNGIQPLSFTDQTSLLKFDQSYWLVTALGMQVTKGTLTFANQVGLDILGTSTTRGLIIGDGITADDALLNLNSSAALRFGSGYFTYNNVQPNYLRTASANASMIRATPSQFYVNTSVVLPPMTFLFESIAVPVAQVATGIQLTYNDVKVKFPIFEAEFTCTSTQARSTLTMSGHGDSIFITKGNLPSPINISGTQNNIMGNGNLLGAITLQDSNTVLAWGIQNGSLAQNMAMNGGRITQSSNFNLGNSILLTGSGNITLGNNTFNFGQTDLSWTNTMYWNGNNAFINISSNVALSSLWTFSGRCILDCNRKTLDIANGSIVVERGSTLTIRNAVLRNINGHNIQCNDSASLLTLSNCSWQQSSNFTFTLGALQLQDNIVLKGQNQIFAYQSSRPVTIQKFSTAMLDTGFTFSYDTGLSANLLQFADSTAKLILNTNSNLHATMQGLNLLVGNLIIENNAMVSAETWTSPDLSSTLDNGITFGDCFNAANDCICTLGGAVILTVASGSLNYKNVNPSSLIIQNNLSALNVLANASLNVYQPMNMGNAITTLGNFATLGRVADSYFIGSVATQGVANFPTLNPC